MKMAERTPKAIFGAASAQTRAVRGESDSESGSTSPKMRISRPVSSSRMKKAELSYTQTSWPRELLDSMWLRLPRRRPLADGDMLGREERRAEGCCWS